MKRHMTLFFCLVLAVVLAVGITVQAESVTVQVEETHPLTGYAVYPVSFVKTSSEAYWDPDTSVNGDTGDGMGWHTAEDTATAYITFDLGASKELCYFAAMPRSPETDGSDYYGRFIKDFALYVTEEAPADYSSLSNPALEASFDPMSQVQWQSVTFPAVTGRYVTVQVKSIAGNTDRDTCVNVREFAFGGVDESGFDATIDYSRPAVTSHTPDASNLYADKWGLFCHFLGYGYSAAEWNAAVNAFDVYDYAKKLDEMGAGYVILTIQQGSENICRPVPNILKKPGNECRNRNNKPTVGTDRDLPADLYFALEPYGIDLYLYQATDYFSQDETGEELTYKVIDDYMREYHDKGVKIAGWYFDGVGGNGYRMLPLRAAVDKWDPECDITFNTGGYQNGNGEDFSHIESYDLMSTAYSVDLGVDGRLANGELATVCTYLSQWYGQDGHDPSNPWLAPNLPGPRYTDEQLIEASKTYIQAGGTITYDVPVFYRTADHEEIDPDKTGSIGLLNKYVEQLKALGAALESVSRDETIAPPVRKMYNDNSTTITYAGSWDYHSYNGQNNPDPYASAYFTDYADVNNPAGSHAGDFHRSNEQGATMTFTFETGVSEQADLVLLGRTGVKMGKASVSVDGGEAVVIDTYAPSLYSQQKLFQAQNLRPGKHTVTVTVLGEQNGNAADCYVAIDAIAVYPTTVDVTAEDLAAYVAGTYIPTISCGAVQLPALLPGAALTLTDVTPAGALTDGNALANPDAAVELSFAIQVEKDGATAKTGIMQINYQPSTQAVPGLAAQASSSDGIEGDKAKAENAVDGNRDTYWHSSYTGGAVLPQTLTLTLPQEMLVSGFTYVPRQGIDNGYITEYEIALSTDGSAYTTVARGTWAESQTDKTAYFTPAQAKYVRLTALKGVNGAQFVSCGEVEVLAANVAQGAEIKLVRGSYAALPDKDGGTFTVADETIARIEDGQLLGVAVGKTTLYWQSGTEQMTYPVTVTGGVTARDPWVQDAKVGFMLHWGILSGTDAHVYEQNFKDYPAYARQVAEYTDENGYLRTHLPDWDARIKDIDVSVWVDEAKKIGADYITFAGFHSGLGYIRPWHSDVPGFPETERDILGELIEAAHAEGIRVVVYMTTSVNHAREDVYGYYRPDEYVKWAKANNRETIDALYGAGTADSLTDAQWQVSFNPVDNSFGFGAFTFDEIEYLMNHYDIDGFWFDAHNNPTWYKADQYPWSGGFVYDGCNGYTDDEGKHTCTDPEAHKGYAYSAESFAENYFYRRDIVGFVKSMDPGCATFENNFPPNLGTEILGQETYSHLGNPDYRIVTEGSPVSEGLYVTATTNTYVDWWMQGNENLTVYNQAELKRIVHTIAAGAISTIGQGPFNDRNTWPKYAADFNTFLSKFNQFAGKAYLADGLTTGYGQTGTYAYGEKNDGAFVMPVQDEADGIHYLHVLTRPSGNTLVLEDVVPFLTKVEAVTAGGRIPLSYTQSGGKLTITIPSWESYDQWGDYILAITENRDVTLEEAAAYLNSSYTPAVSGGSLVLPAVEGMTITVTDAKPTGAVAADGTISTYDGTRMISFRLCLTRGGETAETGAFSFLSAKAGQPAELTGATASSHDPNERNNTADKAVDGDEGTFWHSSYTQGLTLPQNLTVELADRTMVGGIEYVPRQNISNGYITRYEVQISTDGTDFVTVTTGSWNADGTTKTASFTPVEASHVRLVALQGVDGNQFVSCAELRVIAAGQINEAEPLALGVQGTTQLPAVTEGAYTVMDPTVVSLSGETVTGLTLGETWIIWENADKTQAVVYPVQVRSAFPTLTLTFTPDGDGGILTATLTGANPVEHQTITFTVDGDAHTALTDASGTATLTVEVLQPGTHTFGASFAGDAENAAAKAEDVTYTLSSQFRLLCDFEDADDGDFFVDYSNEEDDNPGKCEIVTGEAAISGQKSLRVYNEAGTFWSNGAATKETLSTADISGFAFRLKAAAGTIVKPMLQIDTLHEVNGDLLGGFLVFDRNGTQLSVGDYDGNRTAVNFWSAWGSILFSEDFDGYLFLPYSTKTFDDLDKTTEAGVRFAFHFEHLPANAPEYFVDDFGVYQGEDYAALIEQMNGTETPCTHPETEVRGRVEPTCTEPGYTGDIHCTSCGALLEQGTALEALGHSAGTAWEKNETHHYHVCTRCGETLDETAHTGVLEGYVAPTRWETGYSGDTVCEVCDYLMEQGHTLPKRPGGGTHVKPEEPDEKPETPAADADFIDVEPSDWYYDAVAYVSENGIMTGVAEGVFNPDGAVTRAMVWTVLARMDGVNTEGGSTWYAKAQAWAIDTGVSDGTDPMGTITREQLAAMLYRFADSPAVTGSLSAYPDAASVSDWAEDALIWATETGLINGMSGYLKPQDGATRAQLAMLLMRWIEK